MLEHKWSHVDNGLNPTSNIQAKSWEEWWESGARRVPMDMANQIYAIKYNCLACFLLALKYFLWKIKNK